MLVVVMTAFLKRTKDTDDRRDEATKMVVEGALAREQRAYEDRDRVVAERDAAYNETARLRQQFEEERQRWQETRRWFEQSHQSELEELREQIRRNRLDRPE